MLKLFELAGMLFDQLQHHLVGRQVATLCQTAGQILVLIIVKVIVILIDVKESVRS